MGGSIVRLGLIGLLSSLCLLLLPPISTDTYEIRSASAQISQADNNDSNTLNFFSLPELFSNVEDSAVQVTAVNEQVSLA
jgi:hypothetical protein